MRKSGEEQKTEGEGGESSPGHVEQTNHVFPASLPPEKKRDKPPKKKGQLRQRAITHHEIFILIFERTPWILRLATPWGLPWTLHSSNPRNKNLSFVYEPSPEQNSLEYAQESLSGTSTEHDQDVREPPGEAGQATRDGRYSRGEPRYSVPVVAGGPRSRREGLAAGRVLDQLDQVLPDGRDRTSELRVLDESTGG